MSSPSVRGRFSRRALLRAAGASALAVAGSALLPDSLAAAGAALGVGVVLPRAARSPALAAGLLRGLDLALGGRAPVRVLAAWYEGGQRDAARQVEAMAAGGGVSVVVAAMSRQEAAALGPLLAERGVPLLVADVGATMLRPSWRHPYIFRSSLGHWQSAWALGQWAAANVGRRALIASGFYDSGFDTVHALWSGFEAGGGERPALVVTGGPGAPPDLGAAARAARADLVLAAYSGPGAARFVGGYAGSGLGGLPLLGPGPLVADELLPRQGSAALGVRSASTWAADRPAARALAAGVPADEFAALGYDAGRLLGAAVALAGGRAERLRDALAAAAAEGARGPLAFDPETLEAAAPVALREVLAGPRGLAHVTVADLTPLARQPLAPPAGPRSGWRDAYLMV
jgi:branched-chain amino acid transport system substrate-binding protein